MTPAGRATCMPVLISRSPVVCRTFGFDELFALQPAATNAAAIKAARCRVTGTRIGAGACGSDSPRRAVAFGQRDATYSAVRPSGSASSVTKRVWRSTGRPIADWLPLPIMRASRPIQTSPLRP
jgi:hypothetical protein